MVPEAVESSLQGLANLYALRYHDHVNYIDWMMDREDQKRNESFTSTLSERLQEMGVSAVREDINLSLVGLRSGKHRKVTSYRNINFLPAVAKRNRAKILGILEYAIWRNPQRYRMMVFNMGKRCMVTDIRDRSQKLHRNLSKLAKEMRDKWGFDLVFRSTEYGSMKRYGAFCKGVATFHPHAHCLVVTPYLGSKKYSQFLKWANKRWRSMNNMGSDQSWCPFHDAGKIKEPREVCKYMVKTSDALNLQPWETERLYRETKGLHMVKLLGDLRDIQRLMKDQGTRPVRYRENGKDEWKIAHNWNTHSEAKKEAIKEARINKKIFGSLDSKPRGNVVLALTAPSFQFQHDVCEPLALVDNYTGHLDYLFKDSPECSYMQTVAREIESNTWEHFRGNRHDWLGSQLAERLPVERASGSPSNIYNDTKTVLRNMTVADYRRIRREKKALVAEIPT